MMTTSFISMLKSSLRSLIIFKTRLLRAWGMVQVTLWLSSKYEALSSKPSTMIKNKTQKWKLDFWILCLAFYLDCSYFFCVYVPIWASVGMNICSIL
jgi:hypothetical protein